MMNERKYMNLDENARLNFISLYKQVEAKSPIFRFIKTNQLTMLIWVLYIMFFGFMAIYINYDILQTNISFTIFFLFMCLLNVIKKIKLKYSQHINLIKIIYIIFILSFLYVVNYEIMQNILLSLMLYIYITSGFIGLQKVFEANHLLSHARFLLYSLHIPFSIFMGLPPLYFYAFYHHHHTCNDDWAKFLSYNDPELRFIMDHEGSRNVIASHWHGLSLLTPNKLPVVMIITHLMPVYALFIFGYEIGVLILPLAHGWQHVPKERYGYILGSFMNMLEINGLIANKSDHGKHHIHTIPEVYQDFTSSGFLYSKQMDKLINKLWAKAFYNSQMTPSDWLENYVDIFSVFIIVGFPIILYISQRYIVLLVLFMMIYKLYKSI